MTRNPAITKYRLLACLSRPPSTAEWESVRKALAQSLQRAVKLYEEPSIRAQVFGDLLWALLSGPEFVFNH